MVIDLTLISTSLKEYMYELYCMSYAHTGKPLWFYSPEDLFRPYRFGIISSNHYFLISVIPRNTSGVEQSETHMARSIYKISVLAHVGTPESKADMMDHLDLLLRSPGWVCEASGAVSWILRKRGTPILQTVTEIAQILCPGEQILMNPGYNLRDKHAFVYTHLYFGDKGQVLHQNPQTLFGCLH